MGEVVHFFEFCLNEPFSSATRTRPFRRIVHARAVAHYSQCGFSSPAVGSEVWAARTGQETDDNSPIIAGGGVYLGGLDGAVHCFRAADGQKLWSYSVGAPCFASCAVGEYVITAAVDGTVVALRR